MGGIGSPTLRLATCIVLLSVCDRGETGINGKLTERRTASLCLSIERMPPLHLVIRSALPPHSQADHLPLHRPASSSNARSAHCRYSSPHARALRMEQHCP